MLKLALIGKSVQNSESPSIFASCLEQSCLDGQYTAYDTKPDELQARITKLVDDGFKGFNVTMPYKEDIIPYLDALTTVAKKIGAVNTVTIKDRLLIGDNTDSLGFLNSLDLGYLPSLDRAMVLGAGGASKAVVHALVSLGFNNILVANRTESRAKDIADCFSDAGSTVSAIPLSQASANLKGLDLLVNTTSLGMNGNPQLDLNYSKLQKSTIVSDITYAQEQSDLVRQAQKKGNTVSNGRDMLLQQALLSFRAWTQGV